MRKRIIALLLILTLVFTGCMGTSNSSSPTPQTTELLQALQHADKITIKKVIVSLNTKYNIEIDGTKVGEVSGKYVNLTGDVFTLYDLAGNAVASEKQIKRWGVKLNRLAEVFDSSDTTTGFIGEQRINNLFRVGYTFHFYDQDKNEIGRTKDIFFTFLKRFKVLNNNNEVDYEINANFNLFSPKYTIKVKNKNSDIPVEQVIFFTCIIDAIMSAEKES